MNLGGITLTYRMETEDDDVPSYDEVIWRCHDCRCTCEIVILRLNEAGYPATDFERIREQIETATAAIREKFPRCHSLLEDDPP